jgi:hypothetical protein
MAYTHASACLPRVGEFLCSVGVVDPKYVGSFDSCECHERDAIKCKERVWPCTHHHVESNGHEYELTLDTSHERRESQERSTIGRLVRLLPSFLPPLPSGQIDVLNAFTINASADLVFFFACLATLQVTLAP